MSSRRRKNIAITLSSTTSVGAVLHSNTSSHEFPLEEPNGIFEELFPDKTGSL
jgi:hypothetical protein